MASHEEGSVRDRVFGGGVGDDLGLFGGVEGEFVGEGGLKVRRGLIGAEVIYI